jgi:aryl-alcohol dehydrogenase-like predicted oxidoreductase
MSNASHSCMKCADLSASPNSRGLSRKYMMKAVDASLRRLQTDCIDLYQFHVPDPLTGLEESLDAISELVKAGKVRYFGVSNHSAGQLAKTHFVARYEPSLKLAATQIQYSVPPLGRCLVPASSAAR